MCELADWNRSELLWNLVRRSSGWPAAILIVAIWRNGVHDLIIFSGGTKVF